MLYLRVSDGLVPIGNMNEAEAAFKSAGSNKIETESFDGYTAGVGTSMHEKARGLLQRHLLARLLWIRRKVHLSGLIFAHITTRHPHRRYG